MDSFAPLLVVFHSIASLLLLVRPVLSFLHLFHKFLVRWDLLRRVFVRGLFAFLAAFGNREPVVWRQDE